VSFRGTNMGSVHRRRSLTHTKPRRKVTPYTAQGQKLWHNLILSMSSVIVLFEGHRSRGLKFFGFLLWRRHTLGDRGPHPAIGSDRKSFTDLPRLSSTDRPRATSAICCCTARPLSTSRVLGLRYHLPGSGLSVPCSILGDPARG
jgi:hypothetical protein